MAFSVLVVVRRLESAHGLAHEGKVAGKWSDGENERLLRVVPRLVCVTIFVKQQCCQSTTTGLRITTVNGNNFTLASGKVHGEYPEMIPDHGATSFPAFSVKGSTTTSAISRQSWGQNGTHWPQWMQTKGSVVASR